MTPVIGRYQFVLVDWVSAALMLKGGSMLLRDGAIYVRVSKRLARAFGGSYANLRREITSGNSGLAVHTVPTSNGNRLWYVKLSDVQRALNRDYRPDEDDNGRRTGDDEY